MQPWTPTKNGAVEMISSTLCEISKANDEDLLEALMSMHDKETVALRRRLYNECSRHWMRCNPNAMDNESLHLD
jgi:hypothetical protein